MSIEEEISSARSKIYRDGYDMSFGELINLYDSDELTISPAYQRLFRWSDTQKTRFIESVLLNIPIPPIFVFTNEDATWELVDGLQRVSTILELTGRLRGEHGMLRTPFICQGTRELPSLNGLGWDAVDNAPDEQIGSFTPSMQITVKRAKLRVEILGRETDARVKFELFQRLNTGGSNLSEQEVRNCIIYSINQELFEFINDCASEPQFRRAIDSLTEERIERQYNKELVTRFIAFRHVAYDGRLDVHEYLDNALIDVAENRAFDYPRERDVFDRTFALIATAAGQDSFRRYDGIRFTGPFSLGAYEFITLGVARSVERGDNHSPEFIAEKIRALAEFEPFQKYTGSGVKGTQRFSQLLFRYAEAYFR